MEIGQKLRTLRADRGYTQEKVADMLSIQQARYSKIENNKGRLDMKMLEKIAIIYKIEVKELMNEDNSNLNFQKIPKSKNDLIINNLTKKLTEQYEERLKDKDSMISHLMVLINQLQKK